MKRYNKILKDFEELGLDFRLNDLDDSPEVLMGGEWQLIDDPKTAIIEMRLEELGYGVRGKKKPPMISAKRAMMVRADSQRYNPIKAYFETLTGKYLVNHPPGEMLPQPYVIPAFAEAYCTNPDKYLGVWLFRWMTGCIAKLYEQARNPMLVIVGPQRIGKSRWARWLWPLKRHYREGKIDPDSKDARLRLVDSFIQEVGELGSTTRRADIEALKEHLTKMEVHDRLPYGRLPVQKPVVCNFIGSVNYDGSGFLNDPTGNTRFLLCQIDKFDFAYSVDVDPNRLWEEAWYFYQHVPNCWELTAEERDKQAEINALFETVNPLEDIIEQHLEFVDDPDAHIVAIEIKDRLSEYYKATNDNILYKEIAKVLYRNGCERKREPYREGQPHRWAWYGLKWRQNGK